MKNDRIYTSPEEIGRAATHQVMLPGQGAAHVLLRVTFPSIDYKAQVGYLHYLASALYLEAHRAGTPYHVTLYVEAPVQLDARRYVGRIKLEMTTALEAEREQLVALCRSVVSISGVYAWCESMRSYIAIPDKD